MKIWAQKNSSCHFVSSALHFYFYFYEQIIGRKGDLNWRLSPGHDHSDILMGLWEQGIRMSHSCVSSPIKNSSEYDPRL